MNIKVDVHLFFIWIILFCGLFYQETPNPGIYMVILLSICPSFHLEYVFVEESWICFKITYGNRRN